METRDKAFTLYKKGMGCTEISKKLGVSLNTVKSWKKRYWDAQKGAPKKRTSSHPKGASSKCAQQDPAAQPEKRPNRGGAPKGNVNAVGNHGGAPPGNQNALKHGGWSAVMFGAFSEENQKAIQDCTKDVDAEDLLIQELQLLTAREAFLLQRITAAQEKKQHMSKFNPFDPANGYSEEDRVALETKCASLINRAYRNPFPGASLRHDGADNAGIFFAKQLAHIKTKAYDKEFPELSGLKLFPQTSDTDEGASYIEYYSYEPVGFAAIIANYASDLPRVDVKGTPHRAEIVNIGDSYGYNVQELRACRRNAVLGIMKSLDAVRAEAARRVYDVKVNHLIWNGDEKAKIVGVLSSDNNIPVYTLQNGAGGKAAWASKTADEIAADIAGILNYIDTLTQSVEHPDSWVMPNDLYTALNLRRIDGTGESVLSYIKEHTPQIKNWETAGELSKSNKDYNTTGKNIGLLYTKDADKMYHDVPMAFLQHAPQDRNLEIVINCEGRDAGMVIPYPLSACLVYGL